MLNKIDLVRARGVRASPAGSPGRWPFPPSPARGRELREEIGARIPRPPVEVTLLVPFGREDVTARLYREAEVLSTGPDTDGTVVHARVGLRLSACVPRRSAARPASGRGARSPRASRRPSSRSRCPGPDRARPRTERQELEPNGERDLGEQRRQRRGLLDLVGRDALDAAADDTASTKPSGSGTSAPPRVARSNGTAEPWSRCSTSYPSASIRAPSRSFSAPSRAVIAAGPARDHARAPAPRSPRSRTPRSLLRTAPGTRASASSVIDSAPISARSSPGPAASWCSSRCRSRRSPSARLDRARERGTRFVIVTTSMPRWWRALAASAYAVSPVCVIATIASSGPTIGAQTTNASRRRPRRNDPRPGASRRRARRVVARPGPDARAMGALQALDRRVHLFARRPGGQARGTARRAERRSASRGWWRPASTSGGPPPGRSPELSPRRVLRACGGRPRPCRGSGRRPSRTARARGLRDQHDAAPS